MTIVESTPRFQNEAVVNSLAYELLNAGRANDAVALFRLNTKRHPESWNVWDSLSAGATAAGLKDEAATARQRADKLKK